MTFGDDEPEDAFDASAPDADPEAVAEHLHEVRAQLEALNGTPLRHWHELSIEERALAVAIVVMVVQWLRVQGTRL